MTMRKFSKHTPEQIVVKIEKADASRGEGMSTAHARQGPAHRCTRELGAWIGRLAHILTPHMSALRAPVAAHAHVQDRGTPPVRLVS